MARHSKMTFSKLTPEQQEFAEANHNLIYHYLHKHNLSVAEYYDLVAISYVKAVQLYCAREDLHKYSFGTIFGKNANCAINNHWRDNKKSSRIPSDMLSSLDIPEIRSLLEYENNQTHENLWEHAESQELVRRICQNASERQCKIIRMILDGYRAEEIARDLQISHTCIWRHIRKIRYMIIELGILEPRSMATKG